MSSPISKTGGVQSTTMGSEPISQVAQHALSKSAGRIPRRGTAGSTYKDFKAAAVDLYAGELGLSQNELAKMFGQPPSFHRFHQAALQRAGGKGQAELLNALYWSVRAQRFGLKGKDAQAFVQSNLQNGNADKDLATEINRCLQTTYKQASALSSQTRNSLARIAQDALSRQQAADRNSIRLNKGDTVDFRRTVKLLNAMERDQKVQVNGTTIKPARRARTVAYDPNWSRQDPKRKTRIRLRNKTTAQAITDAHRDSDPGNRDIKVIAVNFANENHCGGRPGYQYRGGRFAVHRSNDRAGAQEENLFEKTDLACSLMKHKDQLYPFDSKQQVHVSDNTLFATDKPDPTGQGSASSDKTSRAVDPVPVTFVTSAAKNYRGGVAPHGTWQQDMRQRIDLQLQAAAKEAEKAHANGQKSHVVLGAFGCGAFAPSHPPDFAKQVAEIYEDLLTDKYDGVFDEVEFALPTFAQGSGLQHDGKQSSAAMGDANYQQFQQVFPPEHDDGMKVYV